jgi:hypothetical protein
MYSKYFNFLSQFCSNLSFDDKCRVNTFLDRIDGIGINPRDFLELIELMNPHLRHFNYNENRILQFQRFSDQLFFEIDLDNDGKIDLYEFLHSYGRFKYILENLSIQSLESQSYLQNINDYLSPESKLRYFFRQVADCYGYIDKRRFTKILLEIKPNLVYDPRFGYDTRIGYNPKLTSNHQQFYEASETLFQEIDKYRTNRLNENQFVEAYPRIHYLFGV